MRRLSALLLIGVVLASAESAGASEPGEELTISLLTMGPGEHPFTKFGHTAIWVHDATSERDEVYNYGTFSFDSPTALLDSVAGKLPYWLSAQSLPGTLRSYREQGRSLTASELELTPAERVALANALRENERPEHRYYRYDYFRDNCATRVRDVIDRVIGGKVHEQSAQPASMSYRSHMLRLVASDPLLYSGLDVAVGRQADVPIAFWDEAFLPQRLHDLLAATQVERDGRPVSLIRSERSLIEGTVTLPAAQPPNWIARYQGLGLALGALFAGLGLLAKRTAAGRVLLGALYLTFGLVLGLLGTALCYLTFFSAHSAAASNYNVLLVPPWALALGISGVGVMRGKPRALRVALWSTMAAFAATDAALVLHLATRDPQANGQELAVALPLWIGAAAAAFFLAGPKTKTAP